MGFSSIIEKKGQAYISGAYLWVIKSIMDSIKKIPSLVSLASITFNDSSGMKNYIGLANE